uniref:Immunoglobulin V-set domain-containing protein n=1 Tax=Periophthalmus magnuspinnatus TaxID=409849 RepID=A0A3B3ZHS0_9GOBI
MSLRGSEHWASAELLDRARVSESGLQTGDCSLLIRDVQVSDGGQYHGYMILDEGQSGTETRTGTGVFIGSVKLLVFDHRSVETKHPGEDLVLNLFTPRSMSLFFQSSNSSEWEMLWTRDIPGPGMGPGSRVQMDSVKNRLLLRSVSQSDQGIYKVLDLDGLTVSSTRLSVDQRENTRCPPIPLCVSPCVCHMPSESSIPCVSDALPSSCILVGQKPSRPPVSLCVIDI